MSELKPVATVGAHGLMSYSKGIDPLPYGSKLYGQDAAATIQRLEAELAAQKKTTAIFEHQAAQYYAELDRLRAVNKELQAQYDDINALRIDRNEARDELKKLRALFPHGPLHEQVAAVLDQLRTPKVTNEMKARFIGEFSWKEDAPYYDEDGDYHEHEAERVVPWDLCKKIYKEMAAFANAALQACAKGDQS